MKNNNNINQELKSKEKVKIDNFEYKSFEEISKEGKGMCKKKPMVTSGLTSLIIFGQSKS